MRSDSRSGRRWRSGAFGAAAALMILVAGISTADEFEDLLERVDEGLRKNPEHVLGTALDACMHRRTVALRLYRIGERDRAHRRLKQCLYLLHLPLEEERPVVPKGPTPEEMQAMAAREVEEALQLEPNVDNGLRVYRECARCHMPEGWGLPNGSVPQIAGQHHSVLIKQLADIRAGNRDVFLMLPYASVESMGGAQAVADVAGYIDTLEISVENSKGPGEDLELGKQLYKENCARCHGPRGEGDAGAFVPRIQSQHYEYLVRQFEWIREGKRRNANAEMVTQIQSFDERQTHAVLDYVSRLEPPEELQAPAGWHNPDFDTTAAAAD